MEVLWLEGGDIVPAGRVMVFALQARGVMPIRDVPRLQVKLPWRHPAIHVPIMAAMRRAAARVMLDVGGAKQLSAL